MPTTEARLRQITESLQLLVHDFRRDDAIAPESALSQPPGASDEAMGVLDSTIRATERAAATVTEAIAKHTVSTNSTLGDGPFCVTKNLPKIQVTGLI